MTTSPISFNSTYCNVCLVGFSGVAPAQQHYSSERHLKKAMIAKLANEREGDETSDALRSLTKVYCKICNISCDTKQMLDEHELTSKHLAACEKRRNRTEFNEAVGGLIFLPSRDVTGAAVSTGNNSVGTVENFQISEDTLSTSALPLNGQQYKFELLHLESVSKPHSESSEEKEYEFTALGRGNCHACNVDLTSARMAKEHLRGLKHQNAKRHWLLKRQCERRSNRNDQHNGVSSTFSSSVEKNSPVQNLFSTALGITDSVSPTSSTPPGVDNERYTDKTRTEPIAPLVKLIDITVNPSLKKQKPCDKTTWVTCSICMKKLNSDKMLNVHMKITHPGRYTEIAGVAEVGNGTIKQAKVFIVDPNSTAFQVAIEQSVKASEEPKATAFKIEHIEMVCSLFNKLKIYARNGDV